MRIVRAAMSAGLTPRSLRGVGKGIVLGVPEASGSLSADIANLSIEDMEEKLRKPSTKRRTSDGGGVITPIGGLTARALLEENRQMIAEKEARRAMARKNSKEEFERLVMQERAVQEGEKARELSKRHAKRELAQHYKAKIGEGEKSKTAKYEVKRQTDKPPTYFPFVEGESIDKERKVKGAELREELRGYLETQRATKPTRKDQLLVDMRGPEINYPLAPASARTRPLPVAESQTSPRPQTPEPSTHLSKLPRFLKRPEEHTTRRHHDDHVRRALEEKVLATKAELEAASKQRVCEADRLDEGMLMGDALRRDAAAASKADRRRNAEALREQIQERRQRAQEEKQASHAEKAGYWGPEDKSTKDPEVQRGHCSDLIKQMEIDQYRKLNDRGQRLRQERRLVDNCVAELSQEKAKELEKLRAHREVLTSTWASQRKIKEALTKLDKM